MSHSNPSPSAGRSDELQTWVWDTGIGNSSVFNIACLAGPTFFVRENILTGGGKDKILRALATGSPPAEAMSGATAIPLVNIRELRFSERLCVLEIHHAAKSPRVVHDKHDAAHRELFDVLRAVLAPNDRPTPGHLTAGSSVMAAFLGLLLTIVIGGSFTIWASLADPNPRNTGRRAGLKNGIDMVLSKIGVLGTLGITLAVSAAFGGWIVYRMKNPHRAEVISIEPRA